MLKKVCSIVYFVGIFVYIYMYVCVYVPRVATRPFDVGPSYFHTMASLGSSCAFWNKTLKNFSKFKMAAIFWSKMKKNWMLTFFSTLYKGIIVTAVIKEKKWIEPISALHKIMNGSEWALSLYVLSRKQYIHYTVKL